MEPFEILINIKTLDKDLEIFNPKKYAQNIPFYAISFDEVIVFTKPLFGNMKKIYGKNGNYSKKIKKLLVGFDGRMYNDTKIKDIIKKIKGDSFNNANNDFFDIRRLKEALKFIQYEKGDELSERINQIVRAEIAKKILPLNPLPIEYKPIEEQKSPSSSICVSEEQEHVNKKKRLLELPTVEEYAELFELIKKKKEEVE